MPRTAVTSARTAAVTDPPRDRTRLSELNKQRTLVLKCLTVLLAMAGPFLGTAPAAASTPMYLGAVGEIAALSNNINAPLALHSYAHFDSKVPSGRMISVKAHASWDGVAAAAPGSPLYNDIVRWANTIKARPGRTMLAFNHEPEASGNVGRGTPADFIAAWRRVVTIFRNQGVQNVDFTLQMTAWAFRTSPTDKRYVGKWYPGDGYVDIIGADAYNWNTCGHGNGRWMQLKELVDPVLAFARAHGKPAALPEYASHRDSRRAQWLRNAQEYLVANRSMIAAAFYFQQDPTNSANSDCRWKLNTAAEFDAYHDMAINRTYFKS